MSINKCRTGILLLVAGAFVMGLIFSCIIQTQDADRAQKFVEQAITIYQEKGINEVIKNINQDDKLRSRDIYTFIYNQQGELVAHIKPELIGKDILTIVDVNGRNIGKRFIKDASLEGAWVTYKWKNPVSKRIEWKASWLVQKDGYTFGGGIHLSEE